jgi:hypothetical protein
MTGNCDQVGLDPWSKRIQPSAAQPEQSDEAAFERVDLGLEDREECSRPR